MTTDFNNDLLERYSRHIMLDNFDLKGQERLKNASILIVGLGGLGTIASLYLASAGVGKLILCDDDVVETSNLQRQILYTDNDVKEKKVMVAKARLFAANPHCQVSVIDSRLTVDNGDDIVKQISVVLDCSDNFATRHLINRICFNNKKPLVFASAVQFDGQLSVFDPHNEQSPCYNCLFDEADIADDTPCALLGVLAPALGVIGSLQAIEAIKLIAMPDTAKTMIGRLLLIDTLNCRFREVALPKDPHCPICLDRQKNDSQ